MGHEEDASDTDASPPEPSPTTAGEGPNRYRWDRSDQPSVAIVEAVAAATGREATALPALHEAIDTDALDALLGGDPSEEAPPGRADANLRVSFAYDGVTVTVSSDDSIEVWPDDETHEHAGP